MVIMWNFREARSSSWWTGPGQPLLIFRLDFSRLDVFGLDVFGLDLGLRDMRHQEAPAPTHQSRGLCPPCPSVAGRGCPAQAGISPAQDDLPKTTCPTRLA